MSVLKREIEWLNIIEFHREIASRAEESFFSLEINSGDSERWTSIDDFYIDTLAGPWEIKSDTIRSMVFLRNIRVKQQLEIFIGGPCWFRWKRGFDNRFNIEWQPLIYKQVKVMVEDSIIKIIPEQGKWEISPLVYKLLEQKGVSTEKPLDQILFELIEISYEISQNNNLPFEKVLVKKIIEYIPDLGNEFNKEFPYRKDLKKPSDWVLFSAPINFSNYTQNLVRDYCTLTKILKEDPNNIGGLSLLEDGEKLKINCPNAIDILPIVPLNESQQQAVQDILSLKPVSVISGPPGCGKSQVVLSTILNAWAKGISVLFVSNNNQAVDVVRKRLESFEDDYPIAIRAGAKNVSNLCETLRRTLNTLTEWNKNNTVMTQLSKQKDMLIEKKYKIQKFLDTQIPYRIDESIKSSFNAYGQYKNLKKEIKDIIDEQKRYLISIGYNLLPDSFEKEVYRPMDEWIQSIYEVKEKIINENRKRQDLSNKIRQYEEKRNKFLNKVGIKNNTFSSFEWLKDQVAFDEFNNWYFKYKEYLKGPLEQYLKPYEWDEKYSQWDTEENIMDWLSTAKEVELNLEQLYTKQLNILSELLQLKDELELKISELEEKGIEPILRIDKSLIESWLVNYTQLQILPRNKLDWIPFSKRNKILKKLKELEVALQPQYSLSIWKAIGMLDEDGRDRLSVYIELVDQWINVDVKWKAVKNERKQIDILLNELNGNILKLGLMPVNNKYNIEEWQVKKKELKSEIEFAYKAKTIFKQRDQFQDAVHNIRSLATEYQSVAMGVPIKENWIKGEGKECSEIILGAGLCAEEDDIINLRHIVYSGVVDEFLSNWKKAAEQEVAIEQVKRQLDQILTENEHIKKWWDKCPISFIQNGNLNSLPNENDEIFVHYKKCGEWLKRWEKIKKTHLADKEKESITEEIWAREKLLSVIKIIPKEYKNLEILKVIEEEVEKDSWDMERIQKYLMQLNPEYLKAKLESINQELEQKSFYYAKITRLHDLSCNKEAQIAVEKLYREYNRNQNQITSQGYQIFEKALEAVPIWITTAQSPQSIPMLPKIFDILIIDEATQCTLTNILPLVYRAKRIAVIGDTEQLPAIDTIGSAAEQALAEKLNIEKYLDMLGHYNNNFYNTALNCLPYRHSDVIGLREHYRSHPLIIGFSNYHVYHNKLAIKKELGTEKYQTFASGVFGKNVRGEAVRGDRQQSWINVQEAKEVCRLVMGIKSETNLSIGIISPFKGQVNLISEELEKVGLISGITVDTVHKYQGDERDIIIFSPVIARGITETTARWVETPHNLINVAVTRAREAIFVVGDFETCKKQQGILGKLIRYVEQIELLRKTSEYELILFSWMVLQGWKIEVHPRVGDLEVDFIVTAQQSRKKVVVEVDGSQHMNEKFQDETRDAYLIAKGYSVIRIIAREVKEMPVEVINCIKVKLEDE